MLKVLAASGVLASLLFSSVPAHAAESGPSVPIKVDVVSVNGSGCANGTASAIVAEENSAFAIVGSPYRAQAGVGATPRDFRKNCHMSLLVHAPRGYTYAIDRVHSYGSMHLEAGAYAVAQTSYYSSGAGITGRTISTFHGPRDTDWWVADDVGAASLMWAPCGAQRLLNINTELRVNAGSSDPKTTSSFISRGDSGGNIDIYHLAWKRCN
ncbi:MAG: DUF4360 domain-containing protein [Longispora sp.]|nr:DUF4360 domain-containing protein [Longispora sp. (in: high G+C Gram-positive bacteria)]